MQEFGGARFVIIRPGLASVTIELCRVVVQKEFKVGVGEVKRTNFVLNAQQPNQHIIIIIIQLRKLWNKCWQGINFV